MRDRNRTIKGYLNILQKTTAPQQSSFQLNADGTMITSQYLFTDVRLFEPGAERLGDEKIVNAPSDIPGPRAGHWAPPTVMSPALLKFPEGIYEARIHKRGE